MNKLTSDMSPWFLMGGAVVGATLIGCGEPPRACIASETHFQLAGTHWQVPQRYLGRSEGYASGGQPRRLCQVAQEPAAVESFAFGPFSAESAVHPQNVVILLRRGPGTEKLRSGMVARSSVAASSDLEGYVRYASSIDFSYSPAGSEGFDLITCSNDDFIDVNKKNLGKNCSGYEQISPEVLVRVDFFTSEWPLSAIDTLKSQTDAFIDSIRQQK